VQGQVVAPVTADFTADETCMLFGSEVHFTDQSQGTVIGWLWDFGDGGTSTEQDPAHTYNAPGTYSVSLTITGLCEFVTETKQGYIEVYSQPIAPTADFIATPGWGFMPLIVEFTDLSRCFVEQWLWDFGDGATSTEQDPTHTYNAPGSYAVSLTASGPGGSDTQVKQDYIEVIDAGPWPMGKHDQIHSARSPYVGPQSDYVRWSTGNEGSAFVTHPVIGKNGTVYAGHTEYPDTGPQIHLLRAVNPNGTIKWDFPIPEGCNFSYNPPTVWTDTVYLSLSCDSGIWGSLYAISPETGLEMWNVPFENPPDMSPIIGRDGTIYTGFGGILYAINPETHEVVWSFPDENSSIGAAAIGEDDTIYVALNTSAYGSAYDGYLWALTPNGEPEWNFAFENFTCYGTRSPPDCGTLSIGQNGVIYAFAGGGDMCGNEIYALYAINPDGKLKWKNDAFGGGGFNQAIGPDGTVYINAIPEAPSGNWTLFAIDPDTGEEKWQFYTGGQSSSPTAVDKDGTIYVHKTSSWSYLVALNPDGTEKWNLFNVIVRKGPAIGRDGVLYFVNPYGMTTTYLVAVGPTSAPLADFVANPTSGNLPLDVQFTDQSTGTVYEWLWDFGDGETGTEQSPLHTYDTVGNYTVSLTVTGPDGSSSETKTNYIQVTEPALVADFIGNPTTGYKPLTVQFTDESTGYITSWSWSFGDGGTSTQQNPIHTYNTTGDYTVSLTVFSHHSGSDTETKINYIHVVEPAPVADFTGNPTTGDEPLTVQFTDLSTGSVTSWLWNFGDGGTSTQQNPPHTYNAAGDYTVSLTVTGPGGSDSETKTEYIHVDPATQPATIIFTWNKKVKAYNIDVSPAEVGTSFSPGTNLKFKVKFTADGDPATLYKVKLNFGKLILLYLPTTDPNRVTKLKNPAGKNFDVQKNITPGEAKIVKLVGYLPSDAEVGQKFKFKGKVKLFKMGDPTVLEEHIVARQFNIVE
jgi:PKD repeat protein